MKILTNVTLGMIVIPMQYVQIPMVAMIVNVLLGFLVMALSAMMKSRVINFLYLLFIFSIFGI